MARESKYKILVSAKMDAASVQTELDRISKKLTLNNLKGTKWVSSNFEDPGFRGESPQSIPLVGFFFDTAEVVEK